MDIFLLTNLSWLAAAVLLLVLGWALLQIARALESIAGTLDKIAWGVRAIDTQTAPLPDHIKTLNNNLTPLAQGLAVVEKGLNSAGGRLDTIAQALGGQRPM